MIISDDRVNSIVKQYVPERYLPKAEGPIRDILWVTGETLDTFIAKTKLSRLVGAKALSVDVNELLGKPEKDNFIIMLSQEIFLEDQLIFVLLHEVGHVDYHFCEDEKKKFGGDTEVYADMFAHDILVKALGFDRGFDMLIKNCSSAGFGKEMLKEYAK